MLQLSAHVFNVYHKKTHVEQWKAFASIRMNIIYSSPSILQPSILRPPLIVRPLDLVLKGNFLCQMTFILRPPAI